MTKIQSDTLFEIKATNGKTCFSDPAFINNRTVPIHRWVPWIAGFSQQFVQGALEQYLSEPGIVLDPFSGVGTTLVEALLAGHRAVGFEINPYAALVCNVKLNAHKIAPVSLEKAIEQFLLFCQNTKEPVSVSPAGFRSRGEFYSPKVLKKVLIVQDFITTLNSDLIRDAFRIAFASTMVTYSNYSYEPSLGQRTSAGKENIETFPVSEIIVRKLREMVEDISFMRKTLNGDCPPSSVYNESFFDSHEHIQPNTVDLLITSPPYLNNYHYNRNTRPHLYWLGFVERPSDFKPLEQNNFGKFWQTVRDASQVDLIAQIQDEEIREYIETLRTLTPEKGIYGGNGWANYAASYFNDCYRFVEAAKKVLKRRGTALVVIGNSILQGVMIPTDRVLGKIAESVGLEVVDIHIPRATRVGNSIIKSGTRVFKAQDKHQLYESIVEFRKR